MPSRADLTLLRGKSGEQPAIELQLPATPFAYRGHDLRRGVALHVYGADGNVLEGRLHRLFIPAAAILQDRVGQQRVDEADAASPNALPTTGGHRHSPARAGHDNSEARARTLAQKLGLVYLAPADIAPDPDAVKIMIGEIRDEETARIAMKSALTGHLVLSTLHTNSAVKTIARLLDMGTERFLLQSTVIGILAQRLVRKNCPHCREPVEEFSRTLEMNLALARADLGRFRVNIYRQRGSIVIRYITDEIPSIQQLNLPDLLEQLVTERQGLILVVGATGSGKSTSLASMIDYRNRNTVSHIVTVEDPIEFVHRHKKSIVDQRELGLHIRLKESGGQDLAPDLDMDDRF